MSYEIHNLSAVFHSWQSVAWYNNRLKFINVSLNRLMRHLRISRPSSRPPDSRIHSQFQSIIQWLNNTLTNPLKTAWFIVSWVFITITLVPNPPRFWQLSGGKRLEFHKVYRLFSTVSHLYYTIMCIDILIVFARFDMYTVEKSTTSAFKGFVLWLRI